MPGSPFDWNDAIVRHGRQVVVALLARRFPLDQAHDLAQEAWSRLISQHREGRLKRIELPGLAVRQALFLASDERRLQARTAPLPNTVIALEDISMEIRLLSKEQLTRAKQAFDTCSTRSREVFQFVYDNPALKHGEAAAKLGISVQRLRQTLCEVRSHLRKSLEDDTL
ncbi:MAG: sigma-70 family RNA polymerase sigma factor [Myxococcaceae bacterium]|nr:sigma-70 family RNA polymerase sigma factor [Myxococcaceae bacterium]